MVTDHNNGGYNMSDSAIGLFLTIVATFQLTYQVRLTYLLLHHVISCDLTDTSLPESSQTVRIQE